MRDRAWHADSQGYALKMFMVNQTLTSSPTITHRVLSVTRWSW